MDWNDRTHQQSIFKWCLPINSSKVGVYVCYMDLIVNFFLVVCYPACIGKLISVFISFPNNAYSCEFLMSRYKLIRQVRLQNSFSKMDSWTGLDVVGSINLWLFYWSKMNYFVLIQLINIFWNIIKINYKLFLTYFKMLLLNLCAFSFSINFLNFIF